MAGQSKIEWTDATWNPVTGCSRVSPGCENCYAETLSLRRGWSKKPWTKQNAAENVALHPDRLEAPLHWRKPRMVFVNSMSDLFHEQIPDEFIDNVFAVMALTPQHTFQVLTKRPERMRNYFALMANGPKSVERAFAVCAWADQLIGGDPSVGSRIRGIPNGLPNVWLGVSVEDQRRANERIPVLLDTPAAVRWISAEPLLGPINLSRQTSQTCPNGSTYLAGYSIDGFVEPPSLDWVVVGGESGPSHRRMEAFWALDIRNECIESGVPFFFKQWGGRTPKAGGRELDGRVWDEMPRVAAQGKG